MSYASRFAWALGPAMVLASCKPAATPESPASKGTPRAKSGEEQSSGNSAGGANKRCFDRVYETKFSPQVQVFGDGFSNACFGSLGNGTPSGNQASMHVLDQKTNRTLVIQWGELHSSLNLALNTKMFSESAYYFGDAPAAQMGQRPPGGAMTSAVSVYYDADAPATYDAPMSAQLSGTKDAPGMSHQNGTKGFTTGWVQVTRFSQGGPNVNDTKTATADLTFEIKTYDLTTRASSTYKGSVKDAVLVIE